MHVHVSSSMIDVTLNDNCNALPDQQDFSGPVGMGQDIIITFTDGSTLTSTLCADIETAEDTILEGDNDFTVSISSVNPDSGVTISDGSSSHDVVILDDDSTCL